MWKYGTLLVVTLTVGSAAGDLCKGVAQYSVAKELSYPKRHCVPRQKYWLFGCQVEPSFRTQSRTFSWEASVGHSQDSQKESRRGLLSSTTRLHDFNATTCVTYHPSTVGPYPHLVPAEISKLFPHLPVKTGWFPGKPQITDALSGCQRLIWCFAWKSRPLA